MNTYYITYIKSHCESPDYEYEGEAENFNSFCQLQVTSEADIYFIAQHTTAIETQRNGFKCSACNEYQNTQTNTGCPIHALQEPQKKSVCNVCNNKPDCICRKEEYTNECTFCFNKPCICDKVDDMIDNEALIRYEEEHENK